MQSIIGWSCSQECLLDLLWLPAVLSGAGFEAFSAHAIWHLIYYPPSNMTFCSYCTWWLMVGLTDWLIEMRYIWDFWIDASVNQQFSTIQENRRWIHIATRARCYIKIACCWGWVSTPQPWTRASLSVLAAGLFMGERKVGEKSWVWDWSNLAVRQRYGGGGLVSRSLLTGWLVGLLFFFFFFFILSLWPLLFFLSVIFILFLFFCYYFLFSTSFFPLLCPFFLHPSLPLFDFN